MLVELSSAFRVRVSGSWSVIPMARFNAGRLEEPSPGYGHSILGFGLSAFVRKSF
jgi:hypothetical protein